MIRAIAICGVKGAGKSTTISALVGALSGRGVLADSFAPFAAGNRAFAESGGLVPAMRRADRKTAEQISAWLAGACRQAWDRMNARAATSGAREAVLVFDRHWITARRALDGSPLAPAVTEEIWRRDWLDPGPPPTVFIHTTPEETMKRRAGQLDSLSGLETRALVEEDYRERLKLRDAHPEHVVGDFETPAHTTDAIVAAILAWLDADVPNGRRPPTVR